MQMSELMMSLPHNSQFILYRTLAKLLILQLWEFKTYQPHLKDAKSLLLKYFVIWVTDFHMLEQKFKNIAMPPIHTHKIVHSSATSMWYQSLNVICKSIKKLLMIKSV